MSALVLANPIINSLEIAKAVEKEHKTVLRDIRTMLSTLYGCDDDGTDLYHPGVRIDRDARNYISLIALDREHAMTLVTGYDVRLRKRVVDKLSEMESKATSTAVALPDFSDPVAAARAWANAEEGRRVAERTKAEIGSRREATAMNTASQARKQAVLLQAEISQLQIELDQSGGYASVKRMEKIHPGRKFSWRDLKRVSERLGAPMPKIEDANYGKVNTYHADAWREAYGIEIAQVAS